MGEAILGLLVRECHFRMAYTDRDKTATQVTSGIVVGAWTLALLAGLTTALNFTVIKKAVIKTVTIDPTKEPPKPPPPPPPKPLPPPPPEQHVTVVQTPHVNIVTPPAPAPTPLPPPPAPVHIVAPPAPPPPPPPPAPTPAVARGSLEFDTEDYPPSSLRNNESGTSVLTFTITTDGRVTNCSASGATPTLNSTACSLATRRWRFKPATQGGQPVESTKTQRVRWVIPTE